MGGASSSSSSLDLSQVTVNNIADYVASLGPNYEQYKQKIIDNSIDGSTLSLLSDEDLIEAFKELEIDSVIHSAKLRSELNKYKSKTNDNINDNVFNEYLKTYRNNAPLQERDDENNTKNIIHNELEVENIVKLRDFTVIQLNEFNGKDDKPIYLSIRGDVFDVTQAKEFYGEGSGYHRFTGRDSSRALAKLSFNDEDITNPDLSDLTSSERAQLDEWYFKFKYVKKYPIVGRLSTPPNDLKLSINELHLYKDTQEIPEGRVDAPLYVAIKGKIFDVSYGGAEIYGREGPYSCFVGNDVSRSLAKMSMREEDLLSSDVSDLSSLETKQLQEWYDKLTSKYPIVGELI